MRAEIQFPSQMKERPNESADTASFEFDALHEAKNYRDALVREFSPFLTGRVIEIGSGIGQVTDLIRQLPGVEYLQAVEPDPGFCYKFRKTHPGQPLIEGTIDAIPEETEWNAILSVNVLEHIRADQAELIHYHRLLKNKEGCLNLLVPARREIYAPIDKDFGHHRRYTKRELKEKLQSAGFEIVRLRYFNFVGYFAWWLLFCVLRKRRFKVDSVRFFDRVIFPMVHQLETKGMAPPFGQSLLAVGRAR
jgi:SAM-dependent methyltransferase